jgi:ABC-2 type transport system ATP-binding protein
MSIIKTDQLTKYYGTCRGIKDLNLRVEEGEVFGFLGPNGAGKTTTIRLLLGLIRPTRGRLFICNEPIIFRSFSYRKDIGYLPGEVSFYPYLTGREFLARLASLRGDADEKYKNLASRLKLDLSKKIKGLSHGTRQKLAIVQTFMYNTRLLILDEPTNGLDPLTQQVFFELVCEERDRGTTVVLSSHVLSEVEHACSRVGIIRDGRLVAVERIDDLKKKGVKQVEVEFGMDVNAAMFHLAGVRSILVEGRKIRFSMEGQYGSILKALTAYPIENVAIKDATLEDIFLEYYSGPGKEEP